MKMSKFLTAKYYQENIERLEKKLAKDIKNLSKQEKEKKKTIWSQTLEKSLRR